MINEKRMIDEFIKLASFDSLSYEEYDISIYLLNKLKNLGLEVEIDDANKKLNNNSKSTGNIYGYLKGNIDGSILFSSHMDTVSPGIGKKVIVDGRIVKSDGKTVLGSDDLTGIVTILEMLTLIKEYNLPHKDIEVIFFVAEEAYCKGSSVFDFSKVKSKYGYVLDLSGKVGLIANKAPSIVSFAINVIGKAAHAGFEPEKGVSAILVAANAISNLTLGRLDDETTLNIGIINGGNGKNIIPDFVNIKGEIRSFSHERALSALDNVRKIFEYEAKVIDARIEFDYTVDIEAYEVSEDSYVIKEYKRVIAKLGYDYFEIESTFGGSDNNNLNKNGIEGIVITNAMNNIHTTNEYFDIDELIKSTNIVLKLIGEE